MSRDDDLNNSFAIANLGGYRVDTARSSSIKSLFALDILQGLYKLADMGNFLAFNSARFLEEMLACQVSFLDNITYGCAANFRVLSNFWVFLFWLFRVLWRRRNSFVGETGSFLIANSLEYSAKIRSITYCKLNSIISGSEIDRCREGGAEENQCKSNGGKAHRRFSGERSTLIKCGGPA
jgi:hypothetical protein